MDPKIEQLVDEVKQYASTRYDLLRLEVLEKLSLIIGLLMVVLISVFLVLIAFAYFTIALAMWLANYMSMSLAFCIIGSVFLVVMAVLVILRKRLFINPLVAQLSGILFREVKQLDSEEFSSAESQTPSSTGEPKSEEDQL
ncbi:MAG: phage holin family protein [Paludibacteraceae bacterium]|nr:phage holin family protein [Bacteroidales bacterium]MBQ9439839.1 phage holin family protein [Paludibacteraceae bacterium]